RIEIAVRSRYSFVVVRSAPGVVGKPCAGCRHLQNAALLATGPRQDDDDMVAADWLAVGSLGQQGEAIATGGPIGADLKFECRLPAAAFNRTVLGRVLPARRDASMLEHLGLGSAVAHDLNVKAWRGRADLQAHPLAGAVGEAVAVAPDLAAVSVHAGCFVVMAAHSQPSLLGCQAEILEFCWQCSHGTPARVADIRRCARPASSNCIGPAARLSLADCDSRPDSWLD